MFDVKAYLHIHTDYECNRHNDMSLLQAFGSFQPACTKGLALKISVFCERSSTTVFLADLKGEKVM